MPAGTEDYYSGALGVVKTTAQASGSVAIDWNVTKWDATVKVNKVNTTTTKLYNAAKKRLWTRYQATSWEVSGTFEFFHDKSNPPGGGGIYPGVVVDIELFTDDSGELKGPALVDQIAYDSGGMDGVQKCTITFSSAGEFTLPGEPES